MSPWNRAYSAPKGYDLRTPYNVPMGEIQQLHVVRPFGIRSYQKNTVVEGFNGPPPTSKKLKKRLDTYFGFPPKTESPPQYIQVVTNPCMNQYCFQVVDGREPCSYRDVQLEKLYLKDRPRVK